MTYGEKFVHDNVTYEVDKNDNPRKAYINAKNHSAARSSYIQKHFMPGITRNYIVNKETGVIQFEVHIRFAKAISKAGDNIPRIFILLNQVFTEATIKLFWEDVWKAHNAIKLRKSRTRIRQLRAHQHNEATALHDECVLATRNMTIRRAASSFSNI